MTRVVFRMFDGECTAVFLDDVWSAVSGEKELGCYARVGQHGGCSRGWVRVTRPAREHEYAPLLAELISIGYEDLRILKRLPTGF